MTENPSKPMRKNAERVQLRKPHPVLAMVSFMATFLFAALPIAFETDHVVVVSVCTIACVTWTILFIRLLVGKLGILKHLFLIVPAILGYAVYAAGQDWHLVVIMTAGTIICSYLVIRLVGDFAPLVRNVSC